jgi:hypothetical protein
MNVQWTRAPVNAPRRRTRRFLPDTDSPSRLQSPSSQHNLARLDSARHHAHVVRPANKLARLHARSALANDLRAASSSNAPLGTFAFFHFTEPQFRISDPTGTQANFSSTSHTNSTDLPPVTICLSCMPLFASHHHGSVHDDVVTTGCLPHQHPGSI